MGSVSVYIRRGRAVAVPWHQLGDGPSVLGDEVVALDLDGWDDARLGRAVRMVLATARTGVDEALDDPWSATLDAFGLKSYSTLVQGLRAISVGEYDVGTVVQPEVRVRNGFEPGTLPETTLEDPSDEELGAAVRQALALVALPPAPRRRG